MLLARHKLTKRLYIFWLHTGAEERNNCLFHLHNMQEVQLSYHDIVRDFEILGEHSVDEAHMELINVFTKELLHVYSMLYGGPKTSS